jgi:hypothetical protein
MSKRPTDPSPRPPQYAVVGHADHSRDISVISCIYCTEPVFSKGCGGPGGVVCRACLAALGRTT